MVTDHGVHLEVSGHRTPQVAASGRAEAAEGNPSAIALNWLLRLRWWVIACQVLLVAAIAALFEVAVPLGVLGLIIGFQAAGNLFFHHLARQGRELSENAFSAVLCTDTLLLTALLYTTGGPMNPFTFLYLVHLALAAILVHPRRAMGLALVAALAYFSLFVLPPYSPSLDLGLASLDVFFTPCHIGSDTVDFFGYEISPHLQGMWVAFAITAFFIVFFVGQIQQALAAHRRTINELREEKSKNDKLASLATLAAGAAHELSTPLATIAVAGKEMELQLGEECDHPDPEQRRRAHRELLEDLTLIRGQVERCREIISQMAADAGEHQGEDAAPFPLSMAVEQALEHFSPEQRRRILVKPVGPEQSATDQQLHKGSSDRIMIRMPLRSLGRVLRGLVKNGLEASPPQELVELEYGVEDDLLIFTVRDRGCGMAEGDRLRAGEPFFTTKEPGKGLGLGLFLARSAAERYGGGLEISSTPGRGSTIRLSFKLELIRERCR